MTLREESNLTDKEWPIPAGGDALIESILGLQRRSMQFPIQPGCYNFNIILSVPPRETDFVDSFFASHEKFMKATHNTSADGSAEPHALAYFITKAPEPVEQIDGSGATDPSKPTTGNTLYALHETYRSPDGCGAHMAAGQADEKLFATFLEIVGKYATSMIMAAPVVQTVSDPLMESLALVTKGCNASHLHFHVAAEDEATADAFFAKHKRFMDETHGFGGKGPDPSVLMYTLTKMAEPVDGNDPSKGTTGNFLYALVDVYKTMEGRLAHRQAWRDWKAARGEPLGEFKALIRSSCKSQVIMADIQHVL